MSGDAAAARARLQSEQREYKEEPLPFGFYARLKKKADGSRDIMTWQCGVLPKATSAYALPSDASYAVELKFGSDFPRDPPTANFTPPIFHTNVFPNDGRVCLSILLEPGHHKGAVKSHWTPTTTVREVLAGLQELLDAPNPESVASAEACELLRTKGKAAYEARVKKEAAAYAAKKAAYEATHKGK